MMPVLEACAIRLARYNIDVLPLPARVSSEAQRKTETPHRAETTRVAPKQQRAETTRTCAYAIRRFLSSAPFRENSRTAACNVRMKPSMSWFDITFLRAQNNTPGPSMDVGSNTGMDSKAS